MQSAGKPFRYGRDEVPASTLYGDPARRRFSGLPCCSLETASDWVGAIPQGTAGNIKYRRKCEIHGFVESIEINLDTIERRPESTTLFDRITEWFIRNLSWEIVRPIIWWLLVFVATI